MLAEITAATRLVIVCNPNNPTSTALPLDEIAAFADEVPPHVALDPRRGLLRVQPARRPRRVDRAARAPPEPRAAADVLEGLRPRRAARRVRAGRQRALRARPSTRCASRSSATPSPRPRRSRRSSTRTRSPSASSARSSRGWRCSPGSRGSACASPSRRRTSAGCTCPRTSRRRRSSTGSRERGVLVRAGAALGREGAMRVTYGRPDENARFLSALAELLADPSSPVPRRARWCTRAFTRAVPSSPCSRSPRRARGPDRHVPGHRDRDAARDRHDHRAPERARAEPRRSTASSATGPARAPASAARSSARSGELIYTDHLFDAYGADDGTRRRAARRGTSRSTSNDARDLPPRGAPCRTTRPANSACPSPEELRYEQNYGDLEPRRRRRPARGPRRRRRQRRSGCWPARRR